MWEEIGGGSMQRTASCAHQAAHALLRHGLFREYGIAKMPELSYGKYGKPFLPDHTEVYFNLSHCRGMAACGFGLGELGVDVERVRSVNASLVRRVLAPEEQEQISKALNQEEMFIRFWTLKESYIKATGEGLSYPLSKITFVLPADTEGLIVSNKPEYRFFQCRPWDGYYLAACIKQEDQDSKFFNTIITDFTQLVAIL
jgi:4'-phosphopantetheinyl transferase